jgi:hypothetical protein
VVFDLLNPLWDTAAVRTLSLTWSQMMTDFNAWEYVA